MRNLRQLAAVACLTMASVTSVAAAPVNGTGLVKPDTIFGSGNANGGFTGETNNNIEVGLRGKQRYPAAEVYNYDGVDTYTFDTTVLTTNPSHRSVFNFEWSVNVDYSGTSGSVLSDFDHVFSYDTDSGAGVTFATLDPFNTPGFFDHSLGDNTTGNGNGIESASNAELTTNSGLYSVAQQSANLGFGYSLDPDKPGSYVFNYSVYEKGTTTLLSSAEITVVATVPLPAGGLLLLTALGGLGFARRRRKSV
ncbi:VPLPA-CTERM sorting domain-containing protein [Roseobacter sp. N2S]|uniref:VPLPA-CTERM sorting domain-containing protein n=1 Tax=Roseobacter sp. N2S TaxID=2663844 RepID=UPI002861D1EB|nr:VPLPA-CTERM sorting domain-containing protein [Roseobacter sp. N2S]MDR6267675.1 hypothetical protein [Roseobacter sp. N2S]